MSDALRKIETELETLKQEELLELMEYIVKKMRVIQEDRKKAVESYYGLYNGLLEKDAQQYVNELREE